MVVHVACVQMRPTMFDVDGNTRRMQQFVEAAAAREPKPNLIIFPELITSGYECGERFAELAETASEGASTRLMREIAAKNGVYIIFGFPERDQSQKPTLYNSAALIGSDGNLIGVYRKLHLFDTEKRYFAAGSDIPVYDTPIGRIGIMICWDAAFPEVARVLALKGADLIVIPTNWEKPYLKSIEQDNARDWDLLTRARAFDNMVYIAAANRTGTDKSLSFFGHSKVVDPMGVPMAELNEEVEGIISAKIDYELFRKLRREYYTFFTDRRPELYGMVTKTGLDKA